jgi:hypothetical protein
MRSYLSGKRAVIRWRKPCEVCHHAEIHEYDFGCHALVIEGPYDCPNQEPCFCSARVDWTLEGIRRLIVKLWWRVFPPMLDDEIPF